MASNKGQWAEALVAQFLQKRHMTIIARNVLYPFGELDIVAQDHKTIVFVEVKYRQSLLYGYPAEAVSKIKQKKIILAAHAFLQRFHLMPLCRFDVVSVTGNMDNPHIDHIIDAFWAED